MTAGVTGADIGTGTSGRVVLFIGFLLLAGGVVIGLFGGLFPRNGG